MLKTFLEKLHLTPHKLKDDPLLKRLLGKALHAHYFWSWEANALAKGCAVGIFSAVLPIPGQMPLAALLALLLRGNLLFALAMTWISNPITFLPITYLIYQTGLFFSSGHAHFHQIAVPSFDLAHFSFKGILKYFARLGKPFLIGLPIVAFAASFFTYCLTLLICWIIKLCRTNGYRH